MANQADFMEFLNSVEFLFLSHAFGSVIKGNYNYVLPTDKSQSEAKS